VQPPGRTTASAATPVGEGEREAKRQKRQQRREGDPGTAQQWVPIILTSWLRERLAAIPEECDLATFSHRVARSAMEASFSLPAGALDGLRDMIRGMVHRELEDGFSGPPG